VHMLTSLLISTALALRPCTALILPPSTNGAGRCAGRSQCHLLLMQQKDDADEPAAAAERSPELRSLLRSLSFDGADELASPAAPAAPAAPTGAAAALAALATGAASLLASLPIGGADESAAPSSEREELIDQLVRYDIAVQEAASRRVVMTSVTAAAVGLAIGGWRQLLNIVAAAIDDAKEAEAIAEAEARALLADRKNTALNTLTDRAQRRTSDLEAELARAKADLARLGGR